MHCAEENLHHFENEIEKQISKLSVTLNIDDLTHTLMCRTKCSRARFRLLQF